MASSGQPDREAARSFARPAYSPFPPPAIHCPRHIYGNSHRDDEPPPRGGADSGVFPPIRARQPAARRAGIGGREGSGAAGEPGLHGIEQAALTQQRLDTRQAAPELRIELRRVA